MTTDRQRAVLHKTIWRVANNLRRSVDGWDFEIYVLGLLFYRFISENLTAYINIWELDAGRSDSDLTRLSDKEAEYVRKDIVNENVTTAVLVKIAEPVDYGLSNIAEIVDDENGEPHV